MSATSSRLTISLLGPIDVSIDGSPLTVDTRKAIALLARLVSDDQRQVRDRLCDLLWPESPPDRARASLRRTLSALRSALGDRWVGADRSFVWIQRDSDIWVDIDVFETNASPSHHHDPGMSCPECVAPLSSAAALYRSRFLDGFEMRGCPDFDDWMLRQAEYLHRRAVSVQRRLTEALLQADRRAEAIAAAVRWVELDPLAEDAHRRLMLLSAWGGDRSAAVQAYRACVETLDRELGIEPLAETIELYEAILEDALPAIPVSRAAVIGASTPHPSPSGFVGRDEDVREILEVVERGHGLVVIDGEVGVGKSRLLREISARLDDSDVTMAVGQSHRTESGVPYGPIQAALRDALRGPDVRARTSALPDAALEQAARLVPSLGSASPLAADDPTAKGRFLDGVARVIGGLAQTTVFCIDNLHWSDDATVEMIAYLAHRLDELGVVLVLTRRPEDTPADHPVASLVGDLAASATTLRLERLSEPDVTLLVEQAGISGLDPGEVYARTRGLPFFVVEYLAAARAGHTDLPVAIRRLLLDRLREIEPIGRQIVSTLAVIGTSSDFDAVKVVSGRSEEEVLQALDDLTRRGILRESGTELDFTHEQLREVAYSETTLTRRRLLHRRVAHHLVQLSGAARDPVAIAGAARHRLAAGDQSEAAALAIAAGDLAAGVFANVDALGHYEQALALTPEDPVISVRIGQMRTQMGHYPQALSSFEAARSRLLTERRQEEAAEAAHLLGEVYRRLGRWELAANEYQEAFAGSTTDEIRSMIAANWAFVLHYNGETDEARMMADRALSHAEDSGDAAAMAQAHNLMGLLVESVRTRRTHLDRALELATDRRTRVAVLNNLALLLVEDGQLTEAIARGTEALEEAKAIGDVHRLGALHDNLADFHHRLGDEETAMAHLKEAVTLFASIDDRADERVPEVWLLKEW